jgi:hypothetical protein
MRCRPRPSTSRTEASFSYKGHGDRREQPVPRRQEGVKGRWSAYDAGLRPFYFDRGLADAEAELVRHGADPNVTRTTE